MARENICAFNITHVKISHLVSVRTACPKLSTSLKQAVNKQFVTNLSILSGLLQGCSSKSDTVMI
jgi:hypothetical protein